MKVKMRVQAVGIGFSWEPGDVIDVAAQEAARLVSARIADYVDEPKSVIEAAALAGPKLRNPSPSRARVQRVPFT